MKKKLTIIFMILSCLTSIYGAEQSLSEGLILDIRPGIEYQKIENFGASDAWTVQKAGLSEYAPLMADKLFSTEMDGSGNPIGIGLSLWRFNLGAGSHGDENIWNLRSSDSFLKADGTYDWSAQAGQRRFLKLASERGVNQFVLFANSPPVNYTLNGKAYGDGSGKSNLNPEFIGDFSRFLVDTTIHFAREEGIRFTRLSPVNEPQWNWSDRNGQEGSPYRNSEIAALVRSLNSELKSRNAELEVLSLHPEIELPEAGKINFLTGIKPIDRGRQLYSFFNERSSNYLGDLEYVAKEVAAHSYYTSRTVHSLINRRERLTRALESYPGISYWMTEFCIIQGDGKVKGRTDIGGMIPALFTARMIHHDLTVANASAWHWWLGIGVDYSYNDGLLFWLKDRTPDFGDSRTLWAMGNYSRFIRPGAVRIGIDRNDNLTLKEQAESLMVSAYLNKGDDSVVIVLINYGDEEDSVSINDLPGINQWNIYVTDETSDLELKAIIEPGQSWTIPRKSISTFVGYGFSAGTE